MKEFKICDLFTYCRFKMESGKVKSCTLAFKKRVLIRLEENGNNISKTAKEFNIQRKNLQRWIQQKGVIFELPNEQSFTCYQSNDQLISSIC